MKTFIPVLAAVALLTGCATVEKVTMAPEVATSLNGKTLAVTTRAAKPDFVALTPTKGALGMIGAIAAISEGNELVKQNAIATPSDAIGQTLGAQLKTARGMQLAAIPVAVASNEPGQIVAAANGAANYILDVQTTNWSFAYYPTAWNRYRVLHNSQARLIDASSQKVVAQGSCAYAPPDDSANAPSYDDLMGKGAEGLKRMLAVAEQDCVAALKRDLFAL